MSPEPDPIRYIERTRRYYLALGYEAPYRWAENDSTPFTPLVKPLNECRVALVTTAALYDPANGDQGHRLTIEHDHQGRAIGREQSPHQA